LPIHDWTRVEAGIFHHFHLSWIDAIARRLNAGLLPDDFYAMREQHAAGFEPGVLTLHATQTGGDNEAAADEAPRFSGKTSAGPLLSAPKTRFVAETDMPFYRRRQNTVTIRHESGDQLVAMVEIVSPANKSARIGSERFVKKAAEFLEHRVHLLILDLLPPGRHDPHGIHSEIWDYIAGHTYSPPPDKPLTLAAYESDLAIRAYVESVAVGDPLPDMPPFLEPGGCVELTLEATYQTAWEAVPRRWKSVIQGER